MVPSQHGLSSSSPVYTHKSSVTNHQTLSFYMILHAGDVFGRCTVVPLISPYVLGAPNLVK